MEFRQKLQNTMDKLKLTRGQFCGITGISKSSLSQYLAGSNEPTDTRMKEMALSLGLPDSYFIDEDAVSTKIEDCIRQKKTIDRLDVMSTSKMMKINHVTLRKGLQQGVFPWGYAIKTSEKKWVYFINAKRFAEIERIEV